ncbi:transposase [Komagataeibacter nataicola]
MGAAARTGSGTTGSGIRNDFSGWHKHQGSPQSGGSPKKGAYRCRHLVENLWARLKEWRAVATRYEKTATSFLAVIHIAAAADWIKP